MEIPEDVFASDLDENVRHELRSLGGPTAERVARHLVAAGQLLDDDPQQALVHARAARASGARLAVVREAVGVAAYQAEEWREALTELRAAYRMSGQIDLLPLIADCERAVGQPERALTVAHSPEASRLTAPASVELLIVETGARRDMGQLDTAIVSLQREVERTDDRAEWAPRLSYAYADALLAAGRREDALRWFTAAAQSDPDATDAAERIADLEAPAPGD